MFLSRARFYQLVGPLGEIVRAAVVSKEVDLVHGAIVPIEPKVQLRAMCTPLKPDQKPLAIAVNNLAGRGCVM